MGAFKCPKVARDGIRARIFKDIAGLELTSDAVALDIELLQQVRGGGRGSWSS